jgi:HEPN domain-containing protein
MKPPEPEVRALATGWLAKAKVDLLVWHQVESPKTHDIQRLLDLLAEVDPDLAGLSADAAEMTPYGVEYRYPGEYPPVRRESALWAQAVARRVYEAAAERVGAG